MEWKIKELMQSLHYCTDLFIEGSFPLLGNSNLKRQLFFIQLLKVFGGDLLFYLQAKNKSTKRLKHDQRRRTER